MKKSIVALTACLALGMELPTAMAASVHEESQNVVNEMASGQTEKAAQTPVAQKPSARQQKTVQSSRHAKSSRKDRAKNAPQEPVNLPQNSTNLSTDYRLRAGDQLNIVVTQQQDLANSSANQTPFTVRPDGWISFPLVGEIHAAGMTVSQFTSVLTTGLSRVIVHPDVSVNITKLGTVRVYVFGEVKKPGAVQLEKSHTVIDAIGAAEGFTRDTAKKKIVLIHQDEPNSMIPVNLNDMLKKGDMSQNYVMREGDLLYLTRNGRIDFARDIAPILSSLYLIAETKDKLDNN